MNIPVEAVEAVARANWEHAFHSEWGKQSVVIQDAYREAARRQVEAAAPFIAAQALRDFAADLVEFMGPDQELNGPEIQVQADDQADTLEGK